MLVAVLDLTLKGFSRAIWVRLSVFHAALLSSADEERTAGWVCMFDLEAAVEMSCAGRIVKSSGNRVTSIGDSFAFVFGISLLLVTGAGCGFVRIFGGPAASRCAEPGTDDVCAIAATRADGLV